MTQTVDFRRVVLFAFCLAVLGVAACHTERHNAALFPSSSDAAGWAKSSDIRTFEAAELWKYIDGEAERYLKAGVQKVSTADYKYQDKVDAVVDIYSMESAAGARKIFESEPPGDAKPVQVGDGGRLYDQSLIFRRGAYLVRIVAYQASRETPQALFELGRAIEQRMAG